MANKLPPPLFQTPMVDARGMVTPQWQGFFREVHQRLGGASGESTTELAAANAALQSTVDDLTAELEATRKGRTL